MNQRNARHLPLIVLILCALAAIGACYYVTLYKGAVVVIPADVTTP